MLKRRIIEITSREGHKLLLLGKSSFWPEIQQLTGSETHSLHMYVGHIKD